MRKLQILTEKSNWVKNYNLTGLCGIRHWPSIKPALRQCVVFAGVKRQDKTQQKHLRKSVLGNGAIQQTRYIDTMLLLAQLFRRCPNIKTTLFQCVMFVLTCWDSTLFLFVIKLK